MPPSYRKPLYRMKKTEEGNPPFVGSKSSWGPGRNEEPCTTGTSAHSHVACHLTRSTLPTALPSINIYFPAVAVPNSFFKLPVADPKLAPTCFFSYVRSLPSLTTLIPSEAEVIVDTVGMLIAGRPTNSYGVPTRLSSLLVLAVGVWLNEGVVRLVLLP